MAWRPPVRAPPARRAPNPARPWPARARRARDRVRCPAPHRGPSAPPDTRAGLGLAPRAVQRGHALAPKPLAQREHTAQRLELADERSVAPARQLGLDPLLQHNRP